MRTALLLALVLFGAAPAWAAEEPSGCDKFKWPIERARAALTAPDRARLASGGELAALPATGLTLALVAPADAKLPNPPEDHEIRAFGEPVGAAGQRQQGQFDLDRGPSDRIRVVG
jgi:hypothetical protein